jgi:hypothetical protein
MKTPIAPTSLPLVDQNNKISKEWAAFFSNLIIQLQTSFSNGVLIPALSTTAINSLVNTSTQPRIVYNIDTNFYMVYKNGAFTNLI